MPFDAASTREKVRWYQTILHIAARAPAITVNGDHNDPATRAALRTFQRQHSLDPTSYLTVEANAALTQLALEWIYRIAIPNPMGAWTPLLRDQIRQFQRDYGLDADGQIGPATREKMVAILLAQLPTPIRNFHSHFGPAAVASEFELASAPTGIIDSDDRRPVPLPAAIPWRWVCRIEIDGLWAATGLLISPRHVLTAGHVVYSDRNDLSGFRFFARARSLTVSPAFDGRRRIHRQFSRRAHFGKWPVDMKRIFLPPCYGANAANDCDLAVLTLKTPIGAAFDPLGYWGWDTAHRINAYQPAPSDKFPITTAGYPGAAHGVMHHAAGRVDNSLRTSAIFDPKHKATIDVFTNRFLHIVDSVPGQSGSPLWRRDSTGIRSLIGIITAIGTRTVDGVLINDHNIGVALTPAILQAIAGWAPKTFRFSAGRLAVR
jgi:V8-like Glu-specific endopeptidase